MKPQERIETLLSSATKGIIEREQARQDRFNRSAKADILSRWRRAFRLAVRYSRAHYKELIHVTSKEHMSGVDCFDGAGARAACPVEGYQLDNDDSNDGDRGEDDLVLIHPVLDGRLADRGRSQ